MRSRLAILVVASSTLALTACGGGGGGGGGGSGGTPLPVTPSPSGELSATDDQALQWLYAETLSTTGGDLTTDAMRFQLYATATPDVRRDLSANLIQPLREAGSSTTDVRAYAQLLWLSKGQLRRLDMRGKLPASGQAVSNATQVCLVSPMSNWFGNVRTDSWLMVWLADNQGQCNTSEQRQGIVAADAGPQASVLDLGPTADSWVLGTLGAADGGRGPLLIQDQAHARLTLLDPSGQGALGTTGTQPLALPWAGLTSASLASFYTVPTVGTQKGMLIVDGHIWVLDWQGGTLRHLPAQTTLTSTSRTRVVGTSDGRYLITTPDQVFVLSTDGSTTPNLVRFSAAPAGLRVTTKATVRKGCALVSRVGMDDVGNSSTLDLLTLDLGSLATVPLQPNTPDASFTAQANDVLQWIPEAQDASLGALWRYHCGTGRGHPLIDGAIQLTAIHQYLGGQERSVAPFVQPPASGFATFLGARQYSGASLMGYLADTDQFVDWGPLPSPKGMQIIGLNSRDRSTQVGDTLLFDGVAVDAQGGNHGVLLSVQVEVAHSVRVLATNLPVP